MSLSSKFQSYLNGVWMQQAALNAYFYSAASLKYHVPSKGTFGHITKTHLFIYIENFTTKNRKISRKKKYSDIFLISAQNIDCEYSLDPPHRGSSNEYPQSMF